MGPVAGQDTVEKRISGRCWKSNSFSRLSGRCLVSTPDKLLGSVTYNLYAKWLNHWRRNNSEIKVSLCDGIRIAHKSEADYTAERVGKSHPCLSLSSTGCAVGSRTHIVGKQKSYIFVLEYGSFLILFPLVLDQFVYQLSGIFCTILYDVRILPSINV
jgi:hypothetical protein